ncbi:MAG: sporulation integral membrane protein YtvI [Clostridia bacterium]|nr:sporulation integral membrane protein YtvI [Clostridia bacterium]
MQNFEHTPTVKRKRFMINFAFFALLFAISIFLVRYALPELFPFFVAFIVTMMLRPIVRFMHNKLKINTRIASVVLVILFYGTIGVIVIWLIIEILSFVADKIMDLPGFFQSQIQPFLVNLFDEIQEMLHNFDPEMAIDFDDTANSLLSTIGSTIMSFSGKLVGSLTDIAVSVPTFLLNIVIMVVATIFLLVDFESIQSFIKKQLPDKTNDLIHNIGTHLGKVLKKYILSYSLIMLITFSEIWAGLSIIGVKYGALIAALIAIFDILPVVGSGLILAPWAIICIILGDIGRAIGLFILWAVLCVVRQIIEPKIVGNSVGMHPFLTLFAMLAGNFIYGGIGILLLPITLALCQSLNSAGVIKIYKNVEPEPEENDIISEAITKSVDAAGVWISKPFKKRLKKKSIKAKKKEKKDTESEQ